jgi:hypothetical protein
MTDYTDNANVKFHIKNREFGGIHFECELPPDVAEMSYPTRFGYAVLEAVKKGVDLSNADLGNVGSVPKIKNIHRAVYAAASVEGALDMDSWHKYGYCGTTHCRAGWVVVLAGEEGRALEDTFGTAMAAAIIYQASDPSLECIPDFYTSDFYALADMKRLAEAEAAKEAQTLSKEMAND